MANKTGEVKEKEGQGRGKRNAFPVQDLCGEPRKEGLLDNLVAGGGSAGSLDGFGQAAPDWTEHKRGDFALRRQ